MVKLPLEFPLYNRNEQMNLLKINIYALFFFYMIWVKILFKKISEFLPRFLNLQT